METVAERIQSIVENSPGLTEVQISESLFGKEGYQQRVNSSCRRLLKMGAVQRHGRGGFREPFQYYIGGRGIRQ